MKRLWKAMFVALMPVLLISIGARYASGSSIYCPPPGNGTVVNTQDVVNSDQTQYQNVFGPGYANANAEAGDAWAEGGDSDSESAAVAFSSLSTTSISKPKVRIPPLSVIPPYLPYWQHGGWGSLNAYFPNGPSSHDEVYERVFNPIDPEDMRELRGVFNWMAYDGILEALGGALNSVRVVFGGPDYFHHGKGFEIASSFIRDRRPQGKPLLVFIDSNVDRKLLEEAGYAYVGKVSLEGDIDRNWDQVYDAAVVESLPWDVDILLISGGMKGVTVGSNISFPGGAGGYSQTNYSLSLFGAMSSGITEGKGKALVSAEGYRYWPTAIRKRRIPRALYDRIHKKPTPMPAPAAQQLAPTNEKAVGVKVSRDLYNLAGFEQGQRVENLIVE